MERRRCRKRRLCTHVCRSAGIGPMSLVGPTAQGLSAAVGQAATPFWASWHSWLATTAAVRGGCCDFDVGRWERNLECTRLGVPTMLAAPPTTRHSKSPATSRHPPVASVESRKAFGAVHGGFPRGRSAGGTCTSRGRSCAAVLSAAVEIWSVCVGKARSTPAFLTMSMICRSKASRSLNSTA
jgi:hypothetical protein